MGKTAKSLNQFLRTITIGPLYSRVPQLQIQPTSEQKYVGKNSRLFQGNFNLPSADNYLHSIYIVYATVYTVFTFYSVQFSPSVMSDSLRSPAPWTAAHQASLSITNSRSLLKLMSTELVIPSNHLILCPPLLLQPSIFPSIRVFSNESALRIR